MKKKPTWLGVVVLILAALTVFGVLMTLTDNFTTAEISRPLNEDNYYTASCMTLEDTNDGSGIIIDVKDNGSIKVKGKTSEDVDYTIGTVVLNKGTYTLNAVSGAALNSVYVTASYGSGTVSVVNADFTGNTFTIGQDNTTVTLKLHVAADTEVNKTVYPVIVSGEESGDYFA